MKAMLSHWRRMHFKVRHNTLQPVLLSRRRQKKPTCLEAGVKLCGTDGQLVWRFYLFVQKVLKSFTRRPQERKHLEDGRIVLRLDCREYDTKAGRIAIDEFGVEAPTTSLFAHIALHYFSPYRPTYRIFEWDNVVDEIGHFHVQGLDLYRSDFQLCEEQLPALMERRQWTGTCYRVHESPRPLHALNPRELELETIPDVEPLSRVFPRNPSGRYFVHL